MLIRPERSGLVILCAESGAESGRTDTVRTSMGERLYRVMERCYCKKGTQCVYQWVVISAVCMSNRMRNRAKREGNAGASG